MIPNIAIRLVEPHNMFVLPLPFHWDLVKMAILNSSERVGCVVRAKRELICVGNFASY